MKSTVVVVVVVVVLLLVRDVFAYVALWHVPHDCGHHGADKRTMQCRQEKNKKSIYELVAVAKADDVEGERERERERERKRERERES
jgi:hypothetical protein